MTKLLALFVFFLLGVASACKPSQPDTSCIDPAKINPDAMCTMQYEPVCGCNGITYGNSCEATRAGVVTYTAGECKTGNNTQ